MVSTSEVLIKIGRALAANADIQSMSVTNFGRGCYVTVGNYSSKGFLDTDAPFIWVSSDDEDAQATNGNVTGLTVKIVSGICPMKDIPSMDEVLADLQAVDTAGSAFVSLSDHAKTPVFDAADCGTSEQAEQLKASWEDAEDALAASRETYDTSISSAFGFLKNGEVANCISSIRSAISAFATMKDQMTAFSNLAATAAGYATTAGEQAKADAAIAEKNQIDLWTTTYSASVTALTSSTNALEAAYAAFEDDPYIREVVSARTDTDNGLTIFGGLRILDTFRRAIYSVINETDVGLPISEIAFRNKSESHYPLDWTEISVVYSQPETLG